MTDSFRTARWIRTLNLVLQAVLFMTFIGGLNYLARSHAWRFDLTRYRRFSLSAETLSYLKELTRPVHIVITSDEKSDDPEVTGLLREYVNATEANAGGQVTVESVDIYQDRRKTEKYGVDKAGVILLLCGDKQRALTVDDLYHVEDKVRKSFVGEQAVTAGILDVSNPDRKKIYFLVGHAELRPDDVDPPAACRWSASSSGSGTTTSTPLSSRPCARCRTTRRSSSASPPSTPSRPFEQELLRYYLGVSAGRLILFLAPNTQPGLKDLLIDDWGILVDDDMVFDLGSDNISEDGDLIIRAFAQHPITQILVDYKEALRIGLARSVRPLPGRPAAAGLTVVTLAATSTTAWGELDYRQRGIQTFTPGVDIKGLPQMDPPNRLGIAVASERVAVRATCPSAWPAAGSSSSAPGT